jgi:hypothetical protein
MGPMLGRGVSLPLSCTLFKREKFPFYIISVTPCISKPGQFDMKSADLESEVCHLSFFALCISEV